MWDIDTRDEHGKLFAKLVDQESGKDITDYLPSGRFIVPFEPGFRLVLIDGFWRIADLNRSKFLGIKIVKSLVSAYICWEEVVMACPEDFVSLPSKFFSNDNYRRYICSVQEALKDRVKYKDNIPEEEYEYAKKILKIVKEKTVTEKSKYLRQQYKQIIDEFEDL